MHGAQRKIYLIHAIHFHFLPLNTLHCIWQGIVPIRRSVFWCNCVRCMSTAVHLSSRLGWGQASPEECFIHFAVAWKPNSLLQRCSSPLPEIQYQVLKSLMQSMHNSLALSNGEVWMLVALFGSISVSASGPGWLLFYFCTPMVTILLWFMFIKGTVRSRLKILLSFAYPQVIQNLYDFIFSVNTKHLTMTVNENWGCQAPKLQKRHKSSSYTMNYFPSLLKS